VRTTKIKVKWICERKSIDYGVESDDRCGEEFDTIETLLEWESCVTHVICPFCGAHLTQEIDIAMVIERGKGKEKNDVYDIVEEEPEESKDNSKIIGDVLFKGFGLNEERI
jgi:hypothetical protein